MMKKYSKLPVKIMLRVFLLSVICIINSSTSQAQVNQINSDSSDLLERPRTCEDWLTTIDAAGREWEKHKDSILIVIARPGSRDTRRINLQRIKTLKEYLLNPVYKIKAVFAEGELTGNETDGFGVIEFYVEGKLFSSAAIKSKSDIPIKPCQIP